MKKFIFLSLICLMMTGLVAQINVFTENFENGADAWTVNQAQGPNRWIHGNATIGSESDYSMYVNNGTDTGHGFVNNQTSVSSFYRSVTIPANPSSITLEFDIHCVAENGYDYVRVYMIPASLGFPSSYSNGGNGDTSFNAYRIGNYLYNLSSWTHQEFTIDSSMSGMPYNLVFTWYNDTSQGGSPGAIDNITLSYTPPPVSNLFFENWEAGSANWTIENGTAANRWVRGTAAYAPGSGSYSMYVSMDSGTSNTYTITAASVVHFYRDIAIPASYTNLNLNFDLRVWGESGYDYVRVYLAPTSYTPVSGELPSTTYRVGGDYHYLDDIWHNIDISVPSSWSGQTVRLIFTWRNDGSVGTSPAGGVDNIIFTYQETNSPPAPAIAVYPSDGAIFVPTYPVTLRWAPDGNNAAPTGYDVYFDSVNPPNNYVYGGSDTSVELWWELDLGTTYYWKVVPYNQYGAPFFSPVWSFTTIPDNLAIIGDGTSYSLTAPVNTYYQYTYSQTLYYAHELTNMSVGDIITDIVWEYYRGGDSRDLAEPIKVYICNTSLNELTTWVDISEFTYVYQGLLSSSGTTDGNRYIIPITLNLDTFSYSGENIIVAVIDYSNDPSYPSNGSSGWYYTEYPEYRTVSYRVDGSVAPDINNPPAGSAYRIAPNIMISFVAPPPIGDGNQSTNAPAWLYYGYSATQQIYDINELSQVGVTAGSLITSVSFQAYGTITINSTTDQWRIYLGETAQSSFTGIGTDAIQLDNMTQVFDGYIDYQVVTSGNWLTFTLDTPFPYTGSGNLVVFVNEYAPSYYGDSSMYFRGTNTGSNKTWYAYQDGSSYIPVGSQQWYQGTTSLTTTRPNLRLASTPPVAGVDLTISSFIVPPLIPSTEDMEITVMSMGTVGVSAGEYTLSIYEDAYPTPIYSTNSTVALAGGGFDSHTYIIPASAYNAWTYNNTTGGDITLRATVTASTDVNNGNNSLEMPSALGMAYDLVLASFTAHNNAEDLLFGWLEVTVRNDGRTPVTANSYTLTIYDNSTSAVLYTSNTGPTIAVGATTEPIVLDSSVVDVDGLQGGVQFRAVVTSNTTADNDPSNNEKIALLSIIPYFVGVGLDGGDRNANYVPVGHYYNHSLTQSIYTATDFHAIPGWISSINYKVTIVSDRFEYIPDPFPIYIYMANVDKPNGFETQLDWVPGNAFTCVAAGVDLPVHQTGTYEIWIALDQPFYYTGGDLVIMTNKSQTTYSSSSNVWYQSPDAGFYQSLYAQNDGSGAYNASDPTMLNESQNYGQQVFHKPQMKFFKDVEGWGVISGVVTGRHGELLEGVTVNIPGSGRTVTTNYDGEYSIAIEVTSNAQLTFTYPDYFETSYPINTLTWTGANWPKAVTQNVALLPNVPATVTGTVTFADLNGPRSGVTVSVGAHSGITNASGMYTIPGVLGDANYTLTVNYPGYNIHTESFFLDIDDIVGGVYSMDPIVIIENIRPPANVTAAMQNGRPYITWNQPNNVRVDFSHTPQESRRMTSDITAERVNGSFIAAHRYTASQLSELGLTDAELTQVNFMPTSLSGSFTVQIWVGANLENPDEKSLVYSQVVSQKLVTGRNNTIILDRSIYLPAGNDLVLGILCDRGGSLALVPTSSNDRRNRNVSATISGFGDKYYIGGRWTTVSDSGRSSGASSWVIGGVAYAPSHTRSFNGTYAVYRRLQGQAFTLASELVYGSPALSYTDYEILPPGTYIYSVAAIFQGVDYDTPGDGHTNQDMTSTPIDATPALDMTASVAVTVNVTTDDGGSVNGALVFATPGGVSATLGVGQSTAVLQLAPGAYTIKVSLAGYVTYENTDTFNANTTLDVVLYGSETIFDGGFVADTTPAGWTLVDGDGDGNQWTFTTTGHDASSLAAYSRSNSAGGSALTPDNWLITPAINVPNDWVNELWLNYHVAPDFITRSQEHFFAYITTSIAGSTPEWSDFLANRNSGANGWTTEALTPGTTLVEDLLFGATVNAWHPGSFDLMPYQGQTVWVAFRHAYSTAQEMLRLSGVHVSSIPEPAFNITGNVTFGPGLLALQGATPLASAVVTFTNALGGAYVPPVATSDGSGFFSSIAKIGSYNLSVAATLTNGKSYTIAHPTPVVITDAGANVDFHFPLWHTISGALTVATATGPVALDGATIAFVNTTQGGHNPASLTSAGGGLYTVEMLAGTYNVTVTGTYNARAYNYTTQYQVADAGTFNMHVPIIYTVGGTVVYGDSSTLVPNATITFTNAGTSEELPAVTSGADGAWSIDLAPGSYSFVATAVINGENYYYSTNSNITVNSDNPNITIAVLPVFYDVTGTVVFAPSTALNGLTVSFTNVAQGGYSPANTTVSGGSYTMHTRAATYNVRVTGVYNSVTFNYLVPEPVVVTGDRTLNIVAEVTATVSGSVTFDDTGSGRAGVTVNIGGLTGNTSATGAYSVANVPVGVAHTVSVNYNGYYPFGGNLTLGLGDVPSNAYTYAPIVISENIRPPASVSVALNASNRPVITWTAPANTRSFTNRYVVYRVIGDAQNLDNAYELAYGVDGLTYTDNVAMLPGTYRYAVAAIYFGNNYDIITPGDGHPNDGNAISTPAFSSTITLGGTGVSVNVHVSTTDSLPNVGGAVIFVTPGGLSATLPPLNTFATFPNLSANQEYTIKVYLPGYVMWEENHTFVSNDNVYAVLSPSNELLPNVNFASLPGGWTSINADGDTYWWRFGAADHQGGNRAAFSESQCQDTGVCVYPDNWLISPAIPIPADGSDVYLNYFVAPNSRQRSQERLFVYITNTIAGATPTWSDFIVNRETHNMDNGWQNEVLATNADVVEFTIFAPGEADWRPVNYDMSMYLGETVYIAFRHAHSEDQDVVKLSGINIRFVPPPIPTYTISGILTYGASATPLIGANVHFTNVVPGAPEVEPNPAVTTAGGAYTTTAYTGNYNVVISGNAADGRYYHYIPSAPVAVLDTDVTHSWHIPAMSTVTGTVYVYTTNGDVPLPNATVTFTNTAVGGYSPEHVDANINGIYSILVPVGTHNVTVHGTLNGREYTYTVPCEVDVTDRSFNVNIPVLHTITGTIVYGAGMPVVGATVTFTNANPTANSPAPVATVAGGVYTIQTIPGSYNVTVNAVIANENYFYVSNTAVVIDDDTTGLQFTVSPVFYTVTGVVDYALSTPTLLEGLTVTFTNIDTGGYMPSPVTTMAGGAYEISIRYGVYTVNVAGTAQDTNTYNYTLPVVVMITGDQVVNVSIPPTFVITGNVTYGATPILGAFVVFTNVDEEGSSPEPVTTDSSGNYSIAMGAGSYLVRTYGVHAGQAFNYSVRMPFEVAEGGETTLNISVPPMFTLSGSVMFDTTPPTPVVLASVSFRNIDSPIYIIPTVVSTDQNGEFNLSTVAGTYEVIVSGEFENYTYEHTQEFEITTAGSQVLNIVLAAPTYTISGVVVFGTVPNLTPIIGGTVSFTNLDTDTGVSPTNVTSGANGAYTITARPGLYSVSVQGNQDGVTIDYTMGSPFEVAFDGATTLNIVVPAPAFTITGTVVFDTLPSATNVIGVNVAFINTNTQGLSPASVLTNDSGQYTITALGGVYNVRVWGLIDDVIDMWDYEFDFTRPQPFTVSGTSATTLPITVPAPTYPVSGRVTLGTGEIAQVGATITFTNVNTELHSPAMVTSVEDGAFTIAPRPGSYNVTAVTTHLGVQYTYSSGSPVEIPRAAALNIHISPLGEDDVTAGVSVTALKSNYPNPFNPTTTISFDIARDGNVLIEIYNAKGQLVKSLVDGGFRAGSHTVVWNGDDSQGRSVGSGVYFYRMVSSEYSSVKKMLLMK